MFALDVINFAMDNQLAGTDPKSGWWGTFGGRKVFQMTPDEIKSLAFKFKIYAGAAVIAAFCTLIWLAYSRQYLALITLTATIYLTLSAKFYHVCAKEQHFLKIMHYVSIVTIPDLSLDNGKTVPRLVLERNHLCNRIYAAQVLIDDYFRPNKPSMAYRYHVEGKIKECRCEEFPIPEVKVATPNNAPVVQNETWTGSLNRLVAYLLNE